MTSHAHCAKQFAKENQARMRAEMERDKLLEICQEIAHDSRVDLIDSERRIRLYSAITYAGGKLEK
jgi:hypothetical protein